jgi:tyrosyl-DNA phosphodiesterase 2
MPIKGVFRVHYDSTIMERDALFVDIALPKEKTLRICSTHLESLIADPPKRPAQLATAASYMHKADASVLGGDLNAIQLFDKTLHQENNLKDAYLEAGGQEGDPSGMTWGQMASTGSRKRFGLSRMDKLLFCGGLQLDGFATFGMDVTLEDGETATWLMKRAQLEKAWVTDHLGVKADFQIAPSLYG